MLGAILKATNRAFQKGITFCRSIYVKKVMKLLAFIFEQPSYQSHGDIRSIVDKLYTVREVASRTPSLYLVCLFFLGGRMGVLYF